MMPKTSSSNSGSSKANSTAVAIREWSQAHGLISLRFRSGGRDE
jgi:hypothetical protein